ncbi:MAG: MerR family DNA-binding transcriptional regulator [Gemmatimonas sp.]|nr:MerR family DNA-binding transcriptional regulator [Gemmatimonas sp.]
MSAQRWKIGELARRTGVTIRALHHYDEIGLLQPASRTESNYRQYREMGEYIGRAIRAHDSTD